MVGIRFQAFDTNLVSLLQFLCVDVLAYGNISFVGSFFEPLIRSMSPLYGG
jgi:hypothetical protein